MASTFAGMSSAGSLAAPSSCMKDNRISSNKLSSLASISSTSFGRRKNVVLRKTRPCQITAAAKELYFNKDGSAIKKLQVSFVFDYACGILFCEFSSGTVLNVVFAAPDWC